MPANRFSDWTYFWKITIETLRCSVHWHFKRQPNTSLQLKRCLSTGNSSAVWFHMFSRSYLYWSNVQHEPSSLLPRACGFLFDSFVTWGKLFKAWSCGMFYPLRDDYICSITQHPSRLFLDLARTWESVVPCWKPRASIWNSRMRGPFFQRVAVGQYLGEKCWFFPYRTDDIRNVHLPSVNVAGKSPQLWDPRGPFPVP